MPKHCNVMRCWKLCCAAACLYRLVCEIASDENERHLNCSQERGARGSARAHYPCSANAAWSSATGHNLCGCDVSRPECLDGICTQVYIIVRTCVCVVLNPTLGLTVQRSTCSFRHASTCLAVGTNKRCGGKHEFSPASTTANWFRHT